MSPEREPMENDSNSRTAEELEQQTVDVYVERALHGPVFRMSYEHTHTYCEIFYLKSGTCTYTVNQVAPGSGRPVYCGCGRPPQHPLRGQNQLRAHYRVL